MTQYTPTWSSAMGLPPKIEDGELVGHYAIHSSNQFDLTMIARMGSSTTYGEGPWVFGLPFFVAHLEGRAISRRCADIEILCALSSVRGCRSPASYSSPSKVMATTRAAKSSE